MTDILDDGNPPLPYFALDEEIIGDARQGNFADITPRELAALRQFGWVRNDGDGERFHMTRPAVPPTIAAPTAGGPRPETRETMTTTIATPAATPADRTALDAAHEKLEADTRAALDEAHRKLEANGTSAAISIAVGPADPAIDAKATAAAELKAAQDAHAPLVRDDARRGAIVKLKAGCRADTTVSPVIGAIDGSTVGRITGDANGSGNVNVEWRDLTWSVVPLDLLELVEDAQEALQPAAAKSMAGRLMALEAGIKGIGDVVKTVNDVRALIDELTKSIASDKAEREAAKARAAATPGVKYVTADELAAALAKAAPPAPPDEAPKA